MPVTMKNKSVVGYIISAFEGEGRVGVPPARESWSIISKSVIFAWLCVVYVPITMKFSKEEYTKNRKIAISRSRFDRF